MKSETESKMKPSFPFGLQGFMIVLLIAFCFLPFISSVSSQSTAPETKPTPNVIALTPTLTEVTYTVSGHVAEFPPCMGSMRGANVHLDPLGLTVQTDISGGNFSFFHIPAGSYTLRVPGCNPFGCWVDTSVIITDTNVFANICMITNTPTSTATPTATLTPTPTLTSTPIPTVETVFDVQVDVALPRTALQVSETITALVTIDNRSVGCQYPVYDLTLSQQGGNVFYFDSPAVVGPPVDAQTVYTVTAITPGVVTLQASAYGERNCGEGWQWTYVNGASSPITVTTTLTGNLYLPVVTSKPLVHDGLNKPIVGQ